MMRTNHPTNSCQCIWLNSVSVFSLSSGVSITMFSKVFGQKWAERPHQFLELTLFIFCRDDAVHVKKKYGTGREKIGLQSHPPTMGQNHFEKGKSKITIIM